MSRLTKEYRRWNRENPEDPIASFEVSCPILRDKRKLGWPQEPKHLGSLAVQGLNEAWQIEKAGFPVDHEIHRTPHPQRAPNRLVLVAAHEVAAAMHRAKQQVAATQKEHETRVQHLQRVADHKEIAKAQREKAIADAASIPELPYVAGALHRTLKKIRGRVELPGEPKPVKCTKRDGITRLSIPVIDEKAIAYQRGAVNVLDKIISGRLPESSPLNVFRYPDGDPPTAPILFHVDDVFKDPPSIPIGVLSPAINGLDINATISTSLQDLTNQYLAARTAIAPLTFGPPQVTWTTTDHMY